MALRGPDAPHTPPAAAQEADQRLHQRRRAALEAPRRADARQVPHEQPEIDAADLVGWTDGGALVVDALSENQGLDINLLALDAEPSLTPLIATEFNEHGPSFSPDGRWLAYTSDHTGVQQVYVQPFPGLDRRIPVSTDGGREPRWSPSGGELFHSSLRGEILAVSIETGPTVTVGEPVSLGILSSNLLQDRAEANTNSYDLDASGERVVVIARGSAGATGSGHIVVVDNWFTELNRLVPID